MLFIPWSNKLVDECIDGDAVADHLDVLLLVDAEIGPLTNATMGRPIVATTS